MKPLLDRLKVILITLKINTMLCEQAQKVRNIYVFSLLHYVRFVSPPNRKVIKITHKSSPFPASDYNHFALNELLINK